MIGKKLGQYEIIAPLGSGGMGDVYRARDTNLMREVAIKVLPEAMTADPERLARLQREAHLLAAVNHPNIAAIYNLEESEGIRWLVLELVEGETLEQRLRQGPLPVQECLRIAGQVAAALEAAHAKGIVHRDLKAANVMQDEEGRVKVLDFGIAKDLSGGAGGALSTDTDLATQANQMAAQLTATGMIVGTVPYMSPEQIRGKGVDKRTDIWAFGCLLFELLTGRRPFDRETMADTLSAVLEHDPDWRFLPEDTPEALHKLINRCLQKDPDSRLHMMADARIEVGEIEATGGRSAVVGRARGGAGSTWLTPKMQAVAIVSVLLPTVLAVGWGLWASLQNAEGGDPTAAASGASLVDIGVEPASVAVLPFQSFLVGTEAAYDADGMAVSILSKLSGIKGLRVTAWTSSSAFRDSDEDIAEIGRDLDVAMILEGTVTSGPDTLSVLVSLVDAASGDILHTVSGNLPRDDLPSIFDFQDEVAAQVVAALDIEMSGDEQGRLASRSTLSLEAYNEYLRGLRAYPLRTPDALNEALESFERAVALDPDFAQAHSGVAISYLLLQTYVRGPDEDMMAAARRSVEEAIRLDPDLGEAHGVLGAVMARERDPGWEAEIERALELDPNSLLILQYYGQRLASSEGPTDKAVDLTRRARDIDPWQPGPNENLGRLLWAAGRLEEAVAQLELVVEIAPEYASGHMTLGVLLQFSGRVDEAINHLRQARQLSPSNFGYVGYLARAYADEGRYAPAESELKGWISAEPDNWEPYAELGDIYRDTGSLDEAAARYQQSLDVRWRPKVVTRMALLDLDRADDAAAEERLARLEQFVEDRGDSEGSRFRVRAQVGRLNVEMYRDRYAEGLPLARELAGVKVVRSYESIWREYADEYPMEPLGYFGVIAGEPDVSREFFRVNFPDLLEEDPPVHAFTLKAAIDLAAVLMHTGEETQATLLLDKSESYIDGLPDAQRRHQFRTAAMEIYALQDRADEAFAAMNQAFEDDWRSGWWRLRHKPHFDSIRDDPRFDAMVERLRVATSG